MAMAGEEDQAENEDMKDVPVERTLKGIQTYKKVIIFLAGVFMNFVLAIVVTLGVNLVSGQIPVNVAQIGTIVDNSPAQQAGLKENDIIQQVDVQETGQTLLVSNFDDLQLTQDYLKTTSQTLNLKVTVLRGEAKEVVDVKVNYNQDDGKYKLGITQATRHMNIAESFQYTFVSLGTMSMAIFSALGAIGY